MELEPLKKAPKATAAADGTAPEAEDAKPKTFKELGVCDELCSFGKPESATDK